MMSLTYQEAALLAFIKQHLAENFGVGPSFDEMKDALGISSKSGVHRTLKALEEKGRIRRLFHRARAIEIVPPEPPLEALSGYSSATLIAELSRRSEEKHAA